MNSLKVSWVSLTTAESSGATASSALTETMLVIAAKTEVMVLIDSCIMTVSKSVFDPNYGRRKTIAFRNTKLKCKVAIKKHAAFLD